jgi:hypothetical protein
MEDYQRIDALPSNIAPAEGALHLDQKDSTGPVYELFRPILTVK